MNLCLKVTDAQGTVLASAQADSEVSLVYDGEYGEGDCLTVESEEAGRFLMLQFDDAMLPALTFLKAGCYSFAVPFGEKRVSYSPRAFSGARHLLYARAARKEEIEARRNLALNPLDTHENTGLFPHASANVETRGEAVFAARNAIDGLKANHYHGEWPYSSWGINRNPQAELKLEFGRRVAIDEAVLYLRADFPHDAWWEKASLRFSDGSSLTVDLVKSDAGQRFSFPPKTVEWVVLDSLIKADDPSPFPALTQIEFYGTEAE